MLARPRLRPSHLVRPSAPSPWPLTPHHLLTLRAYSTSSDANPKTTLAVIGGGLSGLSSAYHFLRALSPEARRAARVVVLEKAGRTGGWCRSVWVPGEKLGAKAVGEGKGVVLEGGPRSVRPVGRIGWATVEMVGRVCEGFPVERQGVQSGNRSGC